jgi:hypothetical protein
MKRRRAVLLPSLERFDNARQSRTGDQPAERGADLGGERHVRVFAAKDHDRIASFRRRRRSRAIPTRRSGSTIVTRAAVEQPFDESLGHVGLARPGGADDRDPVIERLKGKRARQRIPAGIGRQTGYRRRVMLSVTI